MNALPSFDEPTKNTKFRQSQRRRSRSVQTQHQQRRRAVEATTKIATYSLLSLLGITTLVHLISYNWTQQSKLHYLQGALKTTQSQAERLDRDLIRSFDGRATKSVMQENSYKIAPNRPSIAIIDAAAPETSNPRDSAQTK